MNATSDAELIGRSRGGDSDAFARLVARWEGRIYALAYRLTLDADESEDIRQTAFLKVYQSLAGFDGRGSFSTWLHRIVLNLCRDRWRSRQARNAALWQSSDAHERSVRVVRPPSSEAEQAETCCRVAEAVASLPAAVREVVVMRHYEDLRFAEIAEILDAPISTVKSRMTKGLRLLRAQLEDEAS